jgi:hypothetical protein
MKILRLFAAALALAASSGATTVTQQIINPDGTPWFGQIMLTFTAPTTQAGSRVIAESIYVTVTNGAFSKALTPGVYSVSYSPSVGYFSTYWTVPASGTVTIDAIETGVPISPTAGWLLSQLLQSGATTNQVPQWNGTAWVPATVAGGGGTSATIAVGTTTTGAAGTNATVTNTGTTSAAVFNFTIPQGVAGANGSAGATGATGPAGPTGPAGSGLTYAPFSLAASAGGVLNETANWTFAVMNAGTIQACGSVATIAPTGAAMIVDVLKNGMSIFGANPKTTVAVSSTAYAEVTVFSSASVAKGDLITAKLTQADSNSVGQFVRVTCSIQ